MNTVHIHLHPPDAESTEKLIPLLENLVAEVDKITEDHIDKALQRNAGPFNDPKTAAIEEKLDAMRYAEPDQEAPGPQKEESEPTPVREDVYELMTRIIQAGSDNRTKVAGIFKDFGVTSFRKLPEEKLADFQKALEDLEAV